MCETAFCVFFFPTKLTFANCGHTLRPFHRQREWITVARVSENMAPNPGLRTQNIPRMHNFPSSSKQDKCKDPCPPPPQSRKEAEIHNYTPKVRMRLLFDYAVQRASVSLNSPVKGAGRGAGHNNASILKNNRPAPKKVFYSLHPKMKMKQRRNVGPKELGLTKPTHSSANSQVNRRWDKAAKCFHWSPHHSHLTKQVQISRFPQLSDRANLFF